MTPEETHDWLTRRDECEKLISFFWLTRPRVAFIAELVILSRMEEITRIIRSDWPDNTNNQP